MCAGSVYAEIRSRCVRPAQLGPDPCIGRMQAPLAQIRPIAPDCRVKTIGPRRINGVVDAVYPLRVRPEAGLPSQIKRQVNAKSGSLRNWVDQPVKGARPSRL